MVQALPQMIDIQPNLKNTIVAIRPLSFQDFDELFQVASDKEIWKQHPTSDRHTISGFKFFFDESLESLGALIVIDKATGEIIGSSCFKIISESEKIVEIGWTFLARSYWGGKYNRALKKLMVNHILDQSGIVILFADKNNFRSQRAIEKIGGVLVDEANFKFHHKLKSIVTFVIKEKIID